MLEVDQYTADVLNARYGLPKGKAAEGDFRGKCLTDRIGNHDPRAKGGHGLTGHGLGGHPIGAQGQNCRATRAHMRTQRRDINADRCSDMNGPPQTIDAAATRTVDQGQLNGINTRIGISMRHHAACVGEGAIAKVPCPCASIQARSRDTSTGVKGEHCTKTSFYRGVLQCACHVYRRRHHRTVTWCAAAHQRRPIAPSFGPRRKPPGQAARRIGHRIPIAHVVAQQSVICKSIGRSTRRIWSFPEKQGIPFCQREGAE